MADLASDPLAWPPLKAPSLAALEVLAGEAFRALPQGFRDLCADLVIQVDDFPSEEVLTEMQAETEFDLLGLFQGIGLPFRSANARRKAGRDRLRPDRPVSGHRPAVPQRKRRRADAEYDLAVSAADPGLL